MNLPNKLTMLRMLMIPVFAAAFYLPESWVLFTLLETPTRLKYVIAGVIFLAAYVTDMLDGAIARRRGLITDFGKLMDPIADKLLTATAMIMLSRHEVMSFGNALMPVFTVIVIAREFLVSGIRQLAAASGTVIAAKPIGKAKTTLQFAALLSVMLLGQVFAAIRVPLDFIAVVAAVILTVWSGADYVLGARAFFRDR